MDKETEKQILDGLEDGLLPSEIVKEMKNGSVVLKKLRSSLGNPTFKLIMHRLVMPNRVGRRIEKDSKYVVTEEQYRHLEVRVLQALEYVKSRVK